MTLYEDTKKSYYTILKRKLNEGNNMFTVLISKGRCYSGKQAHNSKNNDFKKWVLTQNKILSVSGNIIPVDESIFNNFPQSRPAMCVPQGTPSRKGDRNDWTRNWYWEEKKNDYIRIKSEIDLKLSLLKQNEQEILKPEIIPSVVASSSLIPLVIIAFLLIYSRKGKK